MSFLQNLKVRYFTSMNGEKKRLDYDLNQSSVVIDLGSFHGEFAKDIYNKYKCHVYCFEPYKEFYDYSKLVVIEDKIKFYNYALGDSETKKKIYFKEDETSFFNIGDNYEEILIKEYGKEITNLNIKKIDLMKINIEGAEYDLLEYILDNNFHAQIQNLQIQFHSNVENYKKRKNEIRNKLKRTHKIEWYFPDVWESWSLIR